MTKGSAGARSGGRWSWPAVAMILTLAACGGSGSGAGDPGAGVQGEILISAAASLTDAFAGIEAEFEATNPGVDVVLNLAASSTLREQIIQGAPADVFASADTRNMEMVVEAGDADGEPVVFTTNVLQIAVSPGNPAGVTGLDDFAREELLLGLCAEGTPCGDFAREALSLAGVAAAIDSNEPNVRALLTKVELGELDAGIVYITDVAAANGSVDGVEIPEDLNVVAEYPIATLTNAPNPDGAAAFVAFVLSPEGQAILVEYGFGSP